MRKQYTQLKLEASYRAKLEAIMNFHKCRNLAAANELLIDQDIARNQIPTGPAWTRSEHEKRWPDRSW